MGFWLTLLYVLFCLLAFVLRLRIDLVDFFCKETNKNNE